MQLLKLTVDQKIILLDFLGYKVKNGIIYKKDDTPCKCPYTKEPVRFCDASIMPGSTILFNTTALTLAEYFSEYVENEECECQKEAI